MHTDNNTVGRGQQGSASVEEPLEKIDAAVAADETEKTEPADQAPAAAAVPFPQMTAEERSRRVMLAATQLASQPAGGWKVYYERRAEQLGINPELLAELIQDQIKDREQKDRRAQAEARLGEQRAHRLRQVERDRQRDAAVKSKAEMAADREAEKAERAAEKEAARQRKEVERKAKEKNKSFNNLLKLPVARHGAELEKLAKRLGEEVAALREEFDEFLGVELGAAPAEKTEPWPEPVDIGAVLDVLSDKIRRHVVAQPYQLTAAALWVAHTWLYDSGIPTHSPLLAATSAEPDSGKTTLVTVVGRATPRFSLNIEMSGPSLYRYVDAQKPTLALDECDDLFRRKSDLRHIINAGWTRGATIPRQAKVGSAWVTVHFDPFTPKLVAMLGRNLPATIRTRCIELRMLPKRADEQAEPFDQIDDAEFAILRRKLARFAADSGAALKDAKPTMPRGMNNRAAANWKLLIAIAELAGGSWPEQARKAAERLSYGGRRPSDGVQLLTAFKAAFADSEKDEITSEDMVAGLREDPTSIWADYNHGSAVTQRQVAHLLDPHEIHPVALHPTKRKDFARQGYRLAQFTDAFARYPLADPIIQSPPTASKRRSSKSAKRKRAPRE